MQVHRDGEGDGPRDRDPDRPRDSDPTLMRNQAALTSSTGRIWLVVALITAAIEVAVLLPMAWTGFPPPGVAAVSVGIVLVTVVAMLVVRLAVPPGRVRLWTLAGLYFVLVVVPLVAVIVIALAVRGDGG